MLRNSFPNWHGKFGHLNVLKLDHESACTGYGKHNRVVAFLTQAGTLECRVDKVWGLRNPSPHEVLKAALDQNGRADICRPDLWEYLAVKETETTIEFTFKQKKGN